MSFAAQMLRPGLVSDVIRSGKLVFLFGGSASFLACALVIWAFTQAPIALVSAGDFGTRGVGCKQTLALVKDIKCPLVIVSGNHDQRAVLDDICAVNPRWHLLHGRAVEISAKLFLGIGGEIPRIGSARWNKYIEEDVATELLAQTTGCDVFVSHTPPFGYSDLQSDGSHEGKKSVYSVVLRDQPARCLFDHIPYSRGNIEHLESTLVHNLGPTLNWHSI